MYFELPGRLRLWRAQTLHVAVTKLDPISKCNRRINHYHKHREAHEWCLTIEAVSGELTSHGRMQGAFASSFSWIRYSHAATRPRRLHYSGTTPSTNDVQRQIASVRNLIDAKQQQATVNWSISARSASPSGPRSDHVGINIKGAGGGGGASTPELPKTASDAAI